MSTTELVIFDLDGTILDGQSQMHFLLFLLSERRITYFFYVKLLIWFILYKIGLVSDPKKPMEFAIKFLKGKSVLEVNSWISKFCETRISKLLYHDVLNLIEEHRTRGREILIVSNAIEPIVERIAKMIKIEQFIGSKLETRDNCYTGEILKVNYGDNKVVETKKYADSKGFNLKDAWAYGDHLSDVSLLRSVGHPFAVNPTNALRKFALKEGWTILRVR